MAESAKRDAQEALRVKEAKGETARRDEEALQSQMETITATLKEVHTKEAAQFLVTVAGLASANERRIMNQMQSDKDDLQEANRLLRVAVKKLKTLSTEKQEDILDRLKVKKRKTGRCARCGKDHPTENCYSKVHADGSSLQR
jgi:hypothetical protein